MVVRPAGQPDAAHEIAAVITIAPGMFPNVTEVDAIPVAAGQNNRWIQRCGARGRSKYDGNTSQGWATVRPGNLYDKRIG